MTVIKLNYGPPRHYGNWVAETVDRLWNSRPGLVDLNYYASVGVDFDLVMREVIRVMPLAPTYLIGRSLIADLLVEWVRKQYWPVLEVERNVQHLRFGRMAHSFFGCELWMDLREVDAIPNNLMWLVANDEIVVSFLDTSVMP